MGRHCFLCGNGRCENKEHSSKELADVAYSNVVWASKYAEDCKEDVKAGREVEELEFGTVDMEEGAPKEMEKAEGVALAARFVEEREEGFAEREAANAAEKCKSDEGEAGAGSESEEDSDPETVEKAQRRVVVGGVGDTR
jgi:hypothetical protein